MEELILSILVHNSSGVLTRVSGLFARRGYNIDSLTVGPTSTEGVSRMTVVAQGDQQILEQIEKQLRKLEDVIEIDNGEYKIIGYSDLETKFIDDREISSNKEIEM